MRQGGSGGRLPKIGGGGGARWGGGGGWGGFPKWGGGGFKLGVRGLNPSTNYHSTGTYSGLKEQNVGNVMPH